jgi:flagellar basal body-associated protein FliL
MAEEALDQVTEAPEQEPTKPPFGAALKWTLWIVVSCVVIAAASGAGMAVGRIVQSEPSSGEEAPIPVDQQKATAAQEDYMYYDLPEVTSTLNEARLARYVTAVLKLAIRPDDRRAATEAVEKKKPELISWLHVYLSGLTLDEVRGETSLNRIRRVVLDEFNEQLWPDKRPLIHHILFAKIVIQ